MARAPTTNARWPAPDSDPPATSSALLRPRSTMLEPSSSVPRSTTAYERARALMDAASRPTHTATAMAAANELSSCERVMLHPRTSRPRDTATIVPAAYGRREAGHLGGWRPSRRCGGDRLSRQHRRERLRCVLERRTGSRFAPRAHCLNEWRRARDSNPQGPCGPADFKSAALPVEASPPLRATRRLTIPRPGHALRNFAAKR